MKKTLKEFLKNNRACKDSFNFAKDLTLEEFLTTCQRGDWILWLFATMNPKSLRELTLAKGHCANTVRDLMTDERSTRAVDVAIAFGEGKATIAELAAAAADAWAAWTVAASDAAWAAWASANADSSESAWGIAAGWAASRAAWAVEDAAAWASANAASAARKQNQKLTADICRKYLPLEIWDQNLI